MLTIIPTLEIMKAVTDINVQGVGAEIRRESFDVATDLISRASVEVVLEGGLYGRVKTRLSDDHCRFMESVYRINNSVIGVVGYGSFEAIKWIAKAESRTNIVIILTENPSDYQLSTSDVKVIKPADFIDRVKRAESYCNKGMFTSLTDALVSSIMM